MQRSTWPGGPGGCCNETEDVRPGCERERHGCGWLRTGGSQGWELRQQFSGLFYVCALAHCPLHGFVRSRSKSKGRTFQQKFPINKDLLPPAEVQRGCGGGTRHSSLPQNHDFLTQRCPSVQPFCQALEPHADFLWKSPSSWGDLSSSRAHGWLQFQTSHPGQGLAWSVEVKITHWLFMSKSPQ